MTIANCTVSGNSTSGTSDKGGGIYNTGTATITNCTISGNSSDAASGEGGGIYNNGINIAISNSTISGNSAEAGNGIFNTGGMMTITNSTISGNSASSGGVAGGIYNFTGGTMTITDSTVSGNSTTDIGGIFNNGGTMTISNSTISGNSATTVNVGGIENSSGTVNVKDTIIAGNTSQDFKGALTSQGYNLIGNNSGTTITGTTTGNQLNVDPKLGPLQNNGGPTFTQALLPGSPAIEGGNAGGSQVDQRGFARPVDSPVIANAAGGDGSDIGAYEAQAGQLPGCDNTIVTNNNDSGAGSLRFIMANLCQGATITFASSVVSPINLTSGELAIDKRMTISGPGANLLTVQRDPSASSNFSIFHISSGGTITISGLTITKGNPQHDGGGIFVDTQMILNVTGCAVTGNSASSAGTSPSNGGGIALSGFSLPTAVIDNSTISGNSATADGGGVFVSGGTLDIINSTIAGNAALKLGGGVIPGGTTRIFNSTIANNSAATGGGVRDASGFSVTARNSIIARNMATTADQDFSGPLTSQGFNLIGNGSGATITPAQSTDQIGTAGSPIDPLLGPLHDNGGPTLTLALLPGSRAIDKGGSATDPTTGNPIATDQRGFARPFDNPGVANATGGDGNDIGAFEAQVTVLANISTRLLVETGDNVLIGGFIVSGTQPKKVIIRAIGPSLPLAGRLADPTLELHDASGALLASNDNWQDSPNKQAIIDSMIPPTNPLESAIVATLPANNSGYTAIVRGVNNETGIGVVEAYDLDRSVDSKLANISTRGLVQTGDNVLIAGTIVIGQGAQRVLIRALGPSVPVPGNLADPTLELYDGNGALLEANDNWVDSPNKQAIIDSTIPPTNNLESAIVRALPPANYTAIVRGANNTTGIAVVEIYALQ